MGGYIRMGKWGPGEDGGDQEGTRATRRSHEGLGGYKMAGGLDVPGKG